MNSNQESEMLREIDREIYRSSLTSIFWNVIAARKRKKGGFKLQSLADALDIDKSTVSRWFSHRPNWRANSVSDIAHALDIELRIIAVDRTDGAIYAPTGRVEKDAPTTSTRINIKAPSTPTRTMRSGSTAVTKMVA